MGGARVVEILEHSGWSVRKKATPLTLDAKLSSRYPSLPADYVELLASVESCPSPDDKAWFLCEQEYNGKTDSAYAWNEFEKQSLDGADDDEEWRKEIVRFWDAHFPMLLSVKSGYAYLAIRMSDGAIVCGR